MAVLALRERSGALSPPAAGRILAAVPPVCFTFSDRPRCVSEEGADFLLRGLLLGVEVSESAQSAADKIAEQRNAGTFEKPGHDVELTTEEKRLVLKAASRPGWPGDAETQLIELRAALVAALPMEM